MAEVTTPPHSATSSAASAVRGKRDRGTPTKQTPQQSKKRVLLRERGRSLGCEQSVSTRLPLFPPKSACTWSLEEVKSLVEFVLFHADPMDKWPSHK
jgi:hypothetical protein